MLFNSVEYFIFLSLVFIVYWSIGNHSLKFQNLVILIASYVFYAWWDFRFLLLLIFITIINLIMGLWIAKRKNAPKKYLLILNLFINISVLFFFKYYNFFLDSFIDAFLMIGVKLDRTTLNIILPLGISYYIFQAIGYTLDIYRNKIKPVNDVITFFIYISFFPKIVAGPIERTVDLIPQLEKKRYFEYHKVVDGLRQILWGLFKKIVIADNIALSVNDIFTNYNEYPGFKLFLGLFLFGIQLYADFSGYSDIAIGTARLFGIELTQNFKYPYFSRNIGEFWRRWHISLMTWFREYVFLPTAYKISRNLKKEKYAGIQTEKIIYLAATFITFILCGLWHGANWTYICWGVINACYFVPYILRNKNKRKIRNVQRDRVIPTLSEFYQMVLTFSIITFAWIFFRAESVAQAFNFIKRMFSTTWFVRPDGKILVLILYSLIMLIVEWFQRNKFHGLEIQNFPGYFRWVPYTLIVLSILLLGKFANVQFIYFNF